MSELIYHLYNRHGERVSYVDDEDLLEVLPQSTVEDFIDYCDESVTELTRLRALARVALERKLNPNE